jgi:nicotinamidase-related amidase
MEKCLLIIDVQKGFINQNTAHIPKLIEELQYTYTYVFATKFHNPKDSFFRKLVHWHKFGEGSADCDIAYTPKRDTFIISKDVYTCVNNSFLVKLAALNIGEVHICGLETDMCVTKNAVDLFEAGIVPVVLSTYCASCSGEESHMHALQALRRYIGAEQVL